MIYDLWMIYDFVINCGFWIIGTTGVRDPRRVQLNKAGSAGQRQDISGKTNIGQ